MQLTGGGDRRPPVTQQGKPCEEPPLHYGSVQMPFVMSQRLTLEYTTVIGGVQSGWNVAVAEIEPSALPFCTGTDSPAETVVLFAAFG